MEKLKGKLVIARHDESVWNKAGKWTGQKDVGLSARGMEEANEMAELVKDFTFDIFYTSTLIRAKETAWIILSKHKNRANIEEREARELNERDYGDYTGKNKWEMREALGEDKWNRVRRAWDEPIPNGETLKMVYERVVPFYKEHILPSVAEGKNVLIVAHQNSLRALLKYIEDISDQDIENTDIDFGTFIIFELNTEGKRMSKQEIKTKRKEFKYEHTSFV